MKVQLDPFAQECLEAHYGPSLATGAQAAVRHYARRLRSQRQPIEIPSFGLYKETAATNEGAPLELLLVDEDEAILKERARKESVSLDLVVSHAIFVFIADTDGPIERVADPSQEPKGASRYSSDGRTVPHLAPWRRAARSADHSGLPDRPGRGRRGGAHRHGRFGKR